MTALPTVRLAAIQVAPVFLDLPATLDKVDRLVGEAATGGARRHDHARWLPGGKESRPPHAELISHRRLAEGAQPMHMVFQVAVV